MDLVEAIKAALIADPNVGGALAKWDFGDGDAPAIFDGDEDRPVPTPAPYATIAIDTSSEAGSRTQIGDILGCALEFWGDRSESRRALRRIAGHARLALHEKRLTVDDWPLVFVRANAPTDTVDGEGFPGAAIELVVTMMRDTPQG